MQSVRWAILLSVVLAVPVSAQHIAVESRDVRVVEMASATLDELARVDVPRGPGEHRERRHGRTMLTADETITAAMVVAPQAVAPPPITKGFQAVTDPLPGAQFLYDPPDVSGAVGPYGSMRMPSGPMAPAT